jgi:hypothetical protein
MLPALEQVAPYFAYVGEVRIPIRKLDNVWSEHVPKGSRVYLKIDTQGFERKVLRGAVRSLARISAVQMEISLEPLYEGDILLPEAIRFMGRHGFALMSLEYGFTDPETGRMLQVDGIFVRG